MAETISGKIPELFDLEMDAIQENLDSQDHRQSLSESGYRILKELNNTSNHRIYQRNQIGGFEKYPDTQILTVKEKVNLSDEEMDQEFKILFLKRYVDYSFIPTDEYLEMIKEFPSLTVETLKFGTRLNMKFAGVGSFRLTDRGLFALIDQSVKEMNELNDRLNTTIQKQEMQLDEYRELSGKMDNDLTSTNKNVIEVEGKVSKFNENIFTIFALMIAAFAVIGINMSSIPNIKGDFLLNILAVNFSVCFSLIVLFYLLKVLIYNEKNSGLNWLLLGFGLIFLVVAITQIWIG